MISKVSISNFKSIYKQEIELGRVNVFIGENGSGKSNILEAIAMAAAAKSKSLKPENLDNRGVRVAKPALTFNSFRGMQAKKEIKIDFLEDSYEIKTTLICNNPDDIFANWEDSGTDYTNDYLLKRLRDKLVEEVLDDVNEHVNENAKANNSSEIIDIIREKVNQLTTAALMNKALSKEVENEPLSEFLIYNLNTNALRGLTNISKIQPLGINGEGLDTLLSTFSEEDLLEIKKNNFISWLEDIRIDKEDVLKTSGYKLGRSSSDLYFIDKFMQKKNNLFSAENANEGALHILFYIALLVSRRTPKFFAIDNIESALNPLLCRQLIAAINNLSEKHDKQLLITTHNPAVLDGLNLHDEDQRLFVVKRTDEGHTKVERIKLKPDVKNKSLKLSELWMRGYLGALPSNIF